jgi:hypothetical protein
MGCTVPKGADQYWRRSAFLMQELISASGGGTRRLPG